MKTEMMAMALVIGFTALSAQTEKKTATVRIKKIENINGVEKVTDTTYTSDNPQLIQLEEGNASFSEIKNNDGSPRKVVIIRDNANSPEMKFGAGDPAEIETITINSKEPGERPTIKKIIIKDPSGKGEERVIHVGSAMTSEEEAAFREAAKTGKCDRKIIINEDVTETKDGDKKMTKIIMIRKIQITEPTSEDAKMLGKETGVNGKKLALDKISFYPNPSNGKFNLSFLLPGKGNATVVIFDSAGKIVYNEEVSGGSEMYQKEIDLSGQPRGIYFLSVKQGERSELKKIVLE